jgi:spore coat protein U-like protein
MKLYAIILVVMLSVFIDLAQAHDDDGCSRGKCSCALGLNTVAFGSIFNPLNNTTAQIPVNLNVTCTLLRGSSASISYSVSFAAGNGTVALRKMNGIQTNILNYNLFKDSGYSQILGSGAGGTTNFTNSYALGSSGCPSPCTKNHTIFAKIPVQLLAKPDSTYRDSLTVTLTY